jgi:hypothetical protein
MSKAISETTQQAMLVYYAGMILDKPTVSAFATIPGGATKQTLEAKV